MNKVRNICFLAQFPPPMHGLTKAVDTLYNSILKDKYGFEKINIINNKTILRSLWLLLTTRANIIYFTISQTRGGNWRDLLFLKIISLRKKKCIVHLHGGYYRTLLDKDMNNFQRKLNESAMKKVDAAIVLGDSLHWIFEGLLPDERIYTVKNCIDDQFRIRDINAKINRIGLKQEKLHILYLSNFIASKGYPIVLEIAKIIKDKGLKEKFQFHFAGKFLDEYSGEEKFYHEYVEDNKLDDLVILHGPTYGHDKLELLDMCNVFILPTTYPNEGQPISILEAMGNGMAIVTTDHAGIPDIANAQNGMVLDKKHIDVNVVVDYLEKCYNDRNYLKSVSENNYRTVVKEFTEEAYIRNMDKVFEFIAKS